MSRFRYFDGWVEIGDLRMPLAEFQGYEPGFMPPMGCKDIRYYPAEGKHVRSNGRAQTGGPMPWEAADAYILKIDQYKKLREAKREATKPTLEQQKQIAKSMETNKLIPMLADQLEALIRSVELIEAQQQRSLTPQEQAERDALPATRAELKTIRAETRAMINQLGQGVPLDQILAARGR